MVINKIRKFGNKTYDHSHFSKMCRALVRSRDSSIDLIGHMFFLGGNNNITFNDKVFYVPIQHEDGKKRLGEIAHFSGNLSNLLDTFFSEEELELKKKYNLDNMDIINYREEAENILYGDDHRILKLVGIPVNPDNIYESYLKILYYVAEICNNGREIRSDFFRAVS